MLTLKQKWRQHRQKYRQSPYCGLNFVSLRILMLKSLPPSISDWDSLDIGSIRRWLSENEAVRVGPTPVWLVSLEEEEIWTHRGTPEMHTQRKSHVRTQQEVALCKPRRSLRRNPWIPRFWTFSRWSWERVSLLVQPPAGSISWWRLQAANTRPSPFNPLSSPEVTMTGTVPPDLEPVLLPTQSHPQEVCLYSLYKWDHTINIALLLAFFMEQ